MTNRMKQLHKNTTTMMELMIPYIDKTLETPRLRHRVTYANIDQLITVVHAPPEKEWSLFGINESCILNFSDGSSIHLDMSADQFLDHLNGNSSWAEE